MSPVVAASARPHGTRRDRSLRSPAIPDGICCGARHAARRRACGAPPALTRAARRAAQSAHPAPRPV